MKVPVVHLVGGFTANLPVAHAGRDLIATLTLLLNDFIPLDLLFDDCLGGWMKLQLDCSLIIDRTR